MAGIFIPDMEMPKPGQLVLVEIDENGDVFAAYDGGRTKLTQHKAIPVHDHGRLIDADALCDGLVSNHPVVIHADASRPTTRIHTGAAR